MTGDRIQDHLHVPGMDQLLDYLEKTFKAREKPCIAFKGNFCEAFNDRHLPLRDKPLKNTRIVFEHLLQTQ